MPPGIAKKRHGDTRSRPGIRRLVAIFILGFAFLFAASPSVAGQQVQPMPAVPTPAPLSGVSTKGPSPALELYRQLRSVGLDEKKVFHVRDADLDREDIHLSLTEGTIAFTQAVDGRITGAVFEGDGEILVVPPTQTERASLALFAHAAVLE